MFLLLFLFIAFSNCLKFQNNIEHVNIAQLVEKAKNVLDNNFVQGSHIVEYGFFLKKNIFN